MKESLHHTATAHVLNTSDKCWPLGPPLPPNLATDLRVISPVVDRVVASKFNTV